MLQQGTYTAYRQLKPLEGDVSQDIQQQEENGFRRRAEKRQEDQIAQQKVDKAAKQKQDLWDKYVKPLSNYDTGSKSLNEIQGRLLLDAQKEYVPLMAVINNPNASDEDKLKATLKLDNINKLPDNLLAMTKTLTERDLTVKKGIAEGKLFPNAEYDKNFQEGFSNKLLTLDENGMPMIAFKNPDGTTSLETYDRIQKGVNDYNFKQRFNWDNDLEEASKNVKAIEVIRDNGVKTTTKTGADEGYLNEYVKGQLYLGDGKTPSPRLESYITDFNVSPKDIKAINALEERFKNSIRLKVKGKDSEVQNNSALDYQKEANDQKDKKKGEPKEYLSGKDFAVPGIETASNQFKGSKVYNLTGGNLSRAIGDKGANEIVQSVYVTPSGELVLKGYRVDGETTTAGKNGSKQKTSSKQSNTTSFFYRTKGKDAKYDAVLDFITKKKNPDTNDYYKSIDEFKEVVMRGNGNQSGNNRSSTKPFDATAFYKQYKNKP
jgi:hypothetical protein